MTLVSEIIKDAFREANLIPISQTPTLDEQTEGLRLLNRYLRSVLGYEAGEKLEPFAVGKNNVASPDEVKTYDFTAPNFVPLNSCLVVNQTTPLTLQLHPNPEDGSRLAVIDVSGNFNTVNLTLSGNGRKIDGATTAVLSTANLNKEWFYRADTANWVTVNDLALDSVFPFPTEFDDFFSIGLALRLNPRNGVAVDEQTMLTFRRQRNLFRSRYSQTIETPAEDGLLRLSVGPYQLGAEWDM